MCWYIYLPEQRLKYLTFECSKQVPCFVVESNPRQNNSIAELLIAADTGTASAMLGVYGMKEGRFSELATLDGQYRFYVYEKGHIVAPYGSVGLYWDYRWENGQFSQQELCDPLRRRSAF